MEGGQGGQFGENFLKKSNYAKTESLIKMIFRCFTAKVIPNIALKFDDNWPKGMGLMGGQFEEN